MATKQSASRRFGSGKLRRWLFREHNISNVVGKDRRVYLHAGNRFPRNKCPASRRHALGKRRQSLGDRLLRMRDELHFKVTVARRVLVWIDRHRIGQASGTDIARRRLDQDPTLAPVLVFTDHAPPVISPLGYLTFAARPVISRRVSKTSGRRPGGMPGVFGLAPHRGDA